MRDAETEIQQLSEPAPQTPELTDEQREQLLAMRPKIGLAVIAKNEEDCLGRMLDSFGWTENAELENERGDGVTRTDAAVDFVVVCDTGSTDRTREIARERGCRVIDFDWCDDFSAARQASYDALPPEIQFSVWADADDVVENAGMLYQLAAAMPTTVGGYVFRYDYAQDPAGNCICELWRERLVRRGIGERWKLPVHEVLDVQSSGLQLVHTDGPIWHHYQPENRERIPERNIRILQADYDKAKARGEQPDPRTVAYLGTEALALHRVELAREMFREYLARPDAVWDEERCQVAHKLSVATRVPLDPEVPPDLAESERAAHLAIAERPDWADGYRDLAEIALDRDEPLRALRYCDLIEKLDPPQTLLIINPMEYDYQPLLLRAIALTKLGRTAEALETTEKALAMTPYRDDLKAQYASLAEQAKSDETTRHFLALREALVRHDENEKAAKLMECAPYFISSRPEVQLARLDQREMVLHAFDPQAYSTYYRTNPGEAPFELQGVPIPEAHNAFHRVGFLRHGLDEQAKQTGREISELRILDLSCNDGWMLANLATGGYGTDGALDGLDLNADAISRAEQRAELEGVANVVRDNLFSAPEHFGESSYDAVVCFETIEHVPDPAELLDLMLRMVKSSGRIYVSTPEEAFERGQIDGWATVESKGHLRALRPRDLAELLVERGLVQGFEISGRVMVSSVEPREPVGRVVLFAGPARALPELVVQTGLGGSETALVKIAEAFAQRGYDVRVYAGDGGGLRGDHVASGSDVHTGQIIYAPGNEWDPGMPADLFVSLRLPEAFDRTIVARERWLWLHDATYGGRLTAERIARTTRVLVLSDFHRQILSDESEALADFDGLTVSRNGIETSFFPEPTGKRQPWAVYTSSPDRGLDLLAELWPQIRERAQQLGAVEPQLHHCYAPVYREMLAAGVQPYLSAFHQRLDELLEKAGEGVVSHDSLGQKQIAELFAQSAVWSYPSYFSPGRDWFPEISCISALEAQAAGAQIVSTAFGALPETVQTGGRLLPAKLHQGSPTSGWRSAFVENVAQILADPRDELDDDQLAAREWALAQSWSAVCDDWIGYLQPSAPAETSDLTLSERV